MFDTKRSYFNDLKERNVAAAATLTAEGQILAYVSDGAGGLAVQPSSGAAERIAGFLISDAYLFSTMTAFEQVKVPSTAPYTVTLKNNNVTAASERVYNVTTAAAMAEACPVPAATQYCLVDATGVVTFNVAQAGNTIQIAYRYNLTFEQALAIYHERSINNRAQDFFNSCSIGCLEGEIFTTEYDSSQAYVAGGQIYSGAGGRVTSAAGGVSIGFCSQVPGTADALLGVKFQIPVF